MRYEIGKIYPFINVQFHLKAEYADDPAVSFYMRLFTPKFHVLDAINVRLLMCVEHHKVPGEWDDKLEHDGFIFYEVKDGAVDQIWYNQYPVAHYGQLDDSANRMVNRQHDHITSEQIKEMGIQLGEKGCNEFIDHLLEKWSDGLHFLDNIRRGLQPDYHGDIPIDRMFRDEFREYMKQVKAKIEEATGKRIKCRPLSFGKNRVVGHRHQSMLI